MKKETAKPKSHSALENLCYVFGTLWKENRKYAIGIVLMAFTLPIGWTISPFINKYALEAITVPDKRGQSLLMLALLLLTGCLAEITNSQCSLYNRNYGDSKCNLIFLTKLIKKRMTMDYQNLELTSANDSFQKAYSSINTLHSVEYTLRMTFAHLLEVFIYTAALAALSPFMILLTGVPAVCVFLVNCRVTGWQRRNVDKWTGLDRQLAYVSSAASDFSRAKDIRLYRMETWLEKKFQSIWTERLYWYGEYDKKMTLWQVIMKFITVLTTLASYAILIYMIWHRQIGAGDFMLYFGATQKYAGSIVDLAQTLSRFRGFKDESNYYRDFLALPDKFNHSAGIPLPREARELELKSVSYTYPNAEHPTIKDISFKLHKGEHLAMVGLNGAGKSTLIKLMCGLYDPTEGEILLNGIDIRKFNREEYYSLFSTVFQDFDILPVTIARNITQESDADLSCPKVWEVLQKAGLADKVQTLPKKEHSFLAKSVYEEATDFSGGEMQKLALAKALYKDAPLLLLDEPTAALDAISEQEMYLQYAHFSKDKAGVFISHRLASTRFCDRILFIEDGRIAEQGTHGELMKMGGKYAELFEIQSAYYKETKP